jgi:Sortilin, neurotensin receptor 3, C-terminal
VPVGPEPIPAGVCTGNPDQLYEGSSGFRKVPGNTCVGGVKLDEKVKKKCSQGMFLPFSSWVDIVLMMLGNSST